MKVLLSAMAMALLAVQAEAASSYQIARMSCDAVQDVVRSDGEAMLRWQSKRIAGLPLYGLYVRDSYFCRAGEVAEFASVPTADDASCTVKKCVLKERMDEFDRPRLLLPN